MVIGGVAMDCCGYLEMAIDLDETRLVEICI